MGSHFQAAATADLKTSKLATAQRELEEMYMGVPDESVNLTFQHLVHIKQHQLVTPPMISSPPPPAAASGKTQPDMSASNNTLSKLPGLDFNRTMQASKPSQYHHQTHISSPASKPSQGDAADGTSTDKIKQFVVRSPVNNSPRGVVAGRQGIPHSKTCAICDRHIYVFRHRCLVCGRVYCRNCVNVGMGEMSEGRKCEECLGRRFSQRYIQMAGKTTEWWRFCCWHQSYSDKVRQQELKWAAKGPRVATSRMTQNYNDRRSRNSIITMPPSLSGSQDLHNNKYLKKQQQQQTSSYQNDNPPSFVCTTPSSPTISSPYLHI